MPQPLTSSFVHIALSVSYKDCSASSASSYYPSLRTSSSISVDLPQLNDGSDVTDGSDVNDVNDRKDVNDFTMPTMGEVCNQPTMPLRLVVLI